MATATRTTDKLEATALKRTWLPVAATFAFPVKIAIVILIAMLSYQSLTERAVLAQRMLQAMEAGRQLEALLSVLKDAETGQRGYLLTGDETYLAPYTLATTETPALLHLLQKNRQLDTTGQHMELLKRTVDQKLAELQATIDLRRDDKSAAALARVRSGRGKVLMDQLRELVSQLQLQQQQELQRREALWRDSAQTSTQIVLGGCGILLLLIFGSAAMMSREHRSTQVRNWLRTGRMLVSNRLQGEQSLNVLGTHVLEFLADYLRMPVGVVYTREHDGTFQCCATYALDKAGLDVAPQATAGLLTQAAQRNQPVTITEVPEDYMPIASAIGKSSARQLLIAPAAADGKVQAVLELGFFREVSLHDEELLAQVSESLAIAIRSARDRTQLQTLLAKTRLQAEELQMQQEELRVSNEELEEQSRALKESQAQLESQQAELEQINASLEEHTQLLADQKRRLEESQVVLAAKADELERANQYKSEFLANMSHELRTPLNASLIFAKLLAQNKERNLTDQQVKFAETIWSSGNDLLALINDILDLSKIEAGKVDILIEPLVVKSFAEELVMNFAPLAQERGLRLQFSIADATPSTLQTDSQRLGQILRNLLSNAIKFTERGEVALKIAPGADGFVTFTVIDTGIGIAPEQQSIIFEAFRQADGSTHRKYGGTGLGLSISRDLARLLGGDISVKSETAKGSEFTLRLPIDFVAPMPARDEDIPSHRSSPSPHKKPELATTDAAPTNPQVAASSRRTLLIVEDDAHFSTLLRDMAGEIGFQSVVFDSSQEGLAYARQNAPSAILLDIHLPDGNGLDLLNELKTDPATRHIPVHMISVDDYSQQALQRGAIGYALKPAAHEQISAVLRKLEAKLDQRVRRVLVVEDDARQLDAIRQLLSTGDVTVVGVQTAEAALEQLQGITFDCMVMDLKLPDLSGFELLQRMAECDDVAFPPVIVYTGRLLTADEEQQLRRFSRSIIIKDARSPERLLDEVTLFLHQVESTLPPDRQRMLKLARSREAAFEGRDILVVEDDARNIFALTSILEPKGAHIEVARNGLEALAILEQYKIEAKRFDAVLMDIMMPEMDGYTAMREIRRQPHWKKLPIIALTAKAMRDDQEMCLAAGANDYIAKPLDVDKLLSLLRVWMPK